MSLVKSRQHRDFILLEFQRLGIITMMHHVILPNSLPFPTFTSTHYNQANTIQMTKPRLFSTPVGVQGLTKTGNKPLPEISF